MRADEADPGSEEAYEEAEGAYLDALRADAPRDELTTLAERLAKCAKDFNDELHRQVFATSRDERDQLEMLAERSEVIAEVWDDVHRAYLGD